MIMKSIKSINKKILVLILISFSVISSYSFLNINLKNKKFTELSYLNKTFPKKINPDKIVEKFPELVPISWNTTTNAVDDNILIESIQKIDDYTKKIEKVTPFDWSEIKIKYAGSDTEKMKKFLTLRIIDLKNSILKALKSRHNIKNPEESRFSSCNGENYAFESSNYNNFFKGFFKAFSTDCILFRRGLKTFIKGKFFFISGGSQSLTSDIDISVDFKSFEGKDLSVFEKLHAVAVFIKAYNQKFKEIHKQSSLQTFDVNLYSMNFSYDSIIDKLNYLFSPQSHPDEKTQFIYANRLSVFMLLYNDGFSKMDEFFKYKSNNDIFETLKNLREDFYKNSMENLVKKSDFCGKFLVTNDPNLILTLDEFKTPRDANDEKRNMLMMKSISKAGKLKLENNPMKTYRKEENTMTFLCHNLAANYFALEAYVPYGSIIDMLSLQGILNIDSSRSKEFIINLPKHAMEDSLLMNLSYSIEHYYELMILHNKEKTFFAKEAYKNDAIGKFSKYVARTFRLSNLIDVAYEVNNVKMSYRKIKGISEQDCIKKNLMDFFLKLGIKNLNNFSFKKFQTIKDSKIELKKVDDLKKQLVQRLQTLDQEKRENLIKDLFVNELKECVVYFHLN